MWNKRKLCPALLALVLCCAACGSSEETYLPIKPEEVTDSSPEAEPVLPDHYNAGNAGTKEETVNISAGPDGTVHSVEVDTVLRDLPEEEYLNDVSVLSDIRNKEGAEEYFLLEGNSLVWENSGEDIRYSGTSDASVPVSVSISAWLDGEPVRPEELAGKSGHVKLRFRYFVDANVTTEADGITYTVSVPFTAVTMVPLSDHFTNVTAENGEIIRFQDSEAVICYALPGAAESLRLSSNELTKDAELPEYAEIEADVRSFELDFTATVFTPGLFSAIEDDVFEDAEEMTDGAAELKDASSKLSDGTNELYNGMAEFKTYLNEYNAGIAKAGEGIAALSEGLSTLDDYSCDMKNGACSLADGMKQFSDGLNAIDLSALMPDAADEEQQEMMRQVQAAQEDIGKQAAAMNAALKVMASVYAEMSAFQTSASETAEQLSAALAVMQEDYVPLTDEQQTLIKEAVKNSGDSETILSALSYYVSLPDRLSSITIPEVPEFSGDLNATLTSFNEALTAFSQDLAVLSAYLEGISGQMASMQELPAMVKQMQDAAKKLADGSAQLCSGVKAYTEGVGEIADGAAKLAEAAGAIPEAGNALNEGYGQIVDGTRTLADGMKEFDEKGISELAKYAGSSTKDLIRRAKALRTADGDYTNYAGITDGTKGSVRFLIETDAITNE